MSALTASREDNILIGSTVICAYLGVSSVTTLIQWHEIYGLPVMKRPDGMWMTSMTAIDEWMWLASQAEAENRGYSRGSNLRADKALENAQRRVDRQRAHLMKGAVLPAGPAITKEAK